MIDKQPSMNSKENRRFRSSGLWVWYGAIANEGQRSDSRSWRLSERFVASKMDPGMTRRLGGEQRPLEPIWTSFGRAKGGQNETRTGRANQTWWGCLTMALGTKKQGGKKPRHRRRAALLLPAARGRRGGPPQDHLEPALNGGDGDCPLLTYNHDA